MATEVRERLILREVTESDDWSGIVEKFNYNFDMIKAFGGGDRGLQGLQGVRGLPGATGIGKMGDKGDSGATIHFVQVALTNGQPVTTFTEHREGDVVIDVNGSFFKVTKNAAGNLAYVFEYSLTSAVLRSVVTTENAIVTEGTNPLTRWYQRDTGQVRDSHAVFAERISGNVNDEVGLYKVIVGDSKNPVTQNSALTVVNILPKAATSAKNDFFAQMAFKYRAAPNTNVSSPTATITYRELNKNETTPLGPDDSYLQVENISTGLLMKHDTISTDQSFVAVRGKFTRFIGRASFNNLYAAGTLNNSIGYVDLIIDDINKQTLTFRGGMELNATQRSTISIPTAPLIIDTTYAGMNSASVGDAYKDVAPPTTGMIVEGVVGLGTNAPSTTGGISLDSQRPINVRDAAYLFNSVTTGNDVDHLWFDAADNKFHFTTNTTYKAVGNATVTMGRLETATALFTGDSEFLGVALFTGIPKIGVNRADRYSAIQFDTGLGPGASSIYLMYDTNDNVKDWRVIDSTGSTRKLWHSGNDGAGSDLDADKLDGRQGADYIYRSRNSEPGWVSITNNSPSDPALTLASTIGNSDRLVEFRAGINGGGTFLRAYIEDDGTYYGSDFSVTSDATLKENIKVMSGNFMEMVSLLVPKSFNFKGTKNKKTRTGFIAQEVEDILENVVHTDQDGIKSISMTDLVPYLVGALKEANERIIQLESKMN